MKIGDRVFVLEGLEVAEGVITEIDENGNDAWIQRKGRFKARYSSWWSDLDGAIFHAKAARERKLKALLREVARLAINTSVKVRLLDKPKARNK